MTELTPAQRRALRAQAHHLQPVVSIAGNGLSASVIAEIERNLVAHGLIKIRVYGEERGERAALMQAICDQTAAASVQHIGNILVLWREKPEPAAAKNPPSRSIAKPAPRAPAPRGRSARPALRSGSARPTRPDPAPATATSAADHAAGRAAPARQMTSPPSAL